MKQILFVAIVGLMISTNVIGQGKASIRGRITDDGGANVVGAAVQLLSRAGAQLSADSLIPKQELYRKTSSRTRCAWLAWFC